jgi:hypothetical protein
MKRTLVIIGSISLLSLGFLVLNSFKEDKLEPAEYVKWILDSDNGIWVSKEIDQLKYCLLYKTPEYMIINENRGDQLTPASIEKGKKEYGNMQYYTLRIETKGGEELLRAGVQNESDYYRRMEYFMTTMQSDICLIDGGDTLSCLLFHFEREYGISPYGQFVMAFEKKESVKGKEEDKLLVFDDGTFGVGTVNLIIKGKNINKIPAIKL